VTESLVGIGLYTPAEASALIGVPAGKLSRWLKGHRVEGKPYERLWRPMVELEDGTIALGFRDLMEARVADAFISRGLSPQKVRRAIELARELTGEERPLSTARFRTDGRTVFLQMLAEDGADRLIDLFKRQYEFREVVEPSLKNIDFEAGLPARWWPNGKAAGIVVDPKRAFGQPIEAKSAVPASILAAAADAEGSVEAAARVWAVSPAAIRRALAFQKGFEQRHAA
jgi:uncharacterized protein (DUF433 family)